MPAGLQNQAAGVRPFPFLPGQHVLTSRQTSVSLSVSGASGSDPATCHLNSVDGGDHRSPPHRSERMERERAVTP